MKRVAERPQPSGHKHAVATACPTRHPTRLFLQRHALPLHGAKSSKFQTFQKRRLILTAARLCAFFSACKQNFHFTWCTPFASVAFRSRWASVGASLLGNRHRDEPRTNEDHCRTHGLRCVDVNKSNLRWVILCTCMRPGTVNASQLIRCPLKCCQSPPPASHCLGNPNVQKNAHTLHCHSLSHQDGGLIRLPGNLDLCCILVLRWL